MNDKSKTITKNWPSGKIRSRREILDNRYHGTQISYFPNGQKDSEYKEFDKQCIGLFQKWHDDGSRSFVDVNKVWRQMHGLEIIFVYEIIKSYE